MEDIHEAVAQLTQRLAAHEKRSEARHEHLCEMLARHPESSHAGAYPMEGLNTDKVNINLGGGDGGGGGAGLAAVIAALGNRNETDMGPVMAMLAGKGSHEHSGLGQGTWILGLVALLALLRGGRGGGLFGGGGDCDGGGGGSAVNQLTLDNVLSKLGSIEGAVPLSAANTTNVIQGAISQLALGSQQGFSNTKDAVQNLALFVSNQLNNVNQNVSEQGCQTREVVQAGTSQVLNKINDNLIMDLERRLGVAEALAAEERTNRRLDGVRVDVSQQVVQTQAQAQQQQQLQGMFGQLFSLLSGFNQTMLARQAQDIVNLGTMTASGTQAAANTQVR